MSQDLVADLHEGAVLPLKTLTYDGTDYSAMGRLSPGRGVAAGGAGGCGYPRVHQGAG